ncbi:MAG: hypothetical protein JXK07_09895 [Spirochaetes bacterium]|nr:hypothetical protein [Spirochaetota bacterium]
MNKKQSLKTVGIILCLFIALFFVHTTESIAFSSANIEFDIDESVEDAKYLQWKIKASKDYMVYIYLRSKDGELLCIKFDTRKSKGDYDFSKDYSLYVGIGSDYADGDAEVYESESFYDLISLYISEKDDSEFYSPDTAKIEMIRIAGDDFSLYSITLADNYDSDDPCWQKDASDWDNLNDFNADGGSIPEFFLNITNMSFYDQYVHVYCGATPPYGYTPEPDNISMPDGAQGFTSNGLDTIPFPAFFDYNPYSTTSPYFPAYSTLGLMNSFGQGGGTNISLSPTASTTSSYFPPLTGGYTTASLGSNGIVSIVSQGSLSTLSDSYFSPVLGGYSTSSLGSNGFGSIVSQGSLSTFSDSYFPFAFTPWSGINPFNPSYDLAPPGFGPLRAAINSPPISPSWAPAGMAYDSFSESFYIPGQ